MKSLYESNEGFLGNSVAQFLLALTAFTSLTAVFLSLFWNLRPLSQFLSSVKPLQWNFPGHSLRRKFLCIWAEKQCNELFFIKLLSPLRHDQKLISNLLTAALCVKSFLECWTRTAWKILERWMECFIICNLNYIFLCNSLVSLSFCLFFYSTFHKRTFKKSMAGIVTESIDGLI